MNHTQHESLHMLESDEYRRSNKHCPRVWAISDVANVLSQHQNHESCRIIPNSCLVGCYENVLDISFNVNIAYKSTSHTFLSGRCRVKVSILQIQHDPTCNISYPNVWQ